MANKIAVSQSGVTIVTQTDAPTIEASQSGVTVVTQNNAPTTIVSQSGVSVITEWPAPNTQVSQSSVTVVLCILPEKPTNFSVHANDTGFVLEWTDNCSIETGYTVQRSFNGVTWSTIANLPADTETYTDTLILDDTTYYYRVSATNGICETYSDIITISTFSRFVPCATCETSKGNEGVAVLDADGINPASVFYTLDGGKTWSSVLSPFSATQNIMSVIVFSVNKNTIRWLIAKENDAATSIEIAYSDNLGLTWRTIEVSADIGGAIDSGALFALSKQYIWLGINDGRIFFSDDGGATWEEQTTPIAEDIHAVHFCDTNNGFAVAENGQIIKTDNGGESWERVTDIIGTPTVNCVYCWSEHRAVVGTENGYIYMTFDGGNTWETKKTVDGAITDVSFSDDFVGYASAILNYTPTKGRILRTKNGGQDWESLYTPLCENINALSVVSPNTVWFAGDEADTPFIIKASG